jgi:hypothetical protein
MTSTSGRVAKIYKKPIKLDQVFRECYNGMGKLNLGIHKEEDQTHSTMMMIMRNHLYLPTILVQHDFTVWKLLCTMWCYNGVDKICKI